MPQASDQHRERWFGPDDQYARAYLLGRGYVEIPSQGYGWMAPEHIPDFEVTEVDADAVMFLVCEWDQNGLLDFDRRTYDSERRRQYMRWRRLLEDELDLVDKVAAERMAEEGRFDAW